MGRRERSSGYRYVSLGGGEHGREKTCGYEDTQDSGLWGRRPWIMEGSLWTLKVREHREGK